jgi:protein-tyrosine phosphatase
MRLLFVCTGNVCRSPLAAQLAHAWATASLNGDATQIHISSAGLSAPVDRPMDPYSAAALSRLGGDPTGTRARAFTAAMAQDADLVLTMTRRQRSQVLQLFPRGLRRTFTLLEAADLVSLADLAGFEHVPLPDRARELAERLHAARTQRTAPGVDDIEDPIGRAASVHNRVAEQIAGAMRPLAGVLWPVPTDEPQLGATAVDRSRRGGGSRNGRGALGRRSAAQDPRGRG